MLSILRGVLLGPPPNPPPGPNAAGLMPPPWAAYPSLPQTLCSMAWKQGSGECYIGVFREWWEAQPPEVWARVAIAYPEPQGFAGFYHGWGLRAESDLNANDMGI